MQLAHIVIHTEGHITTLMLNRPERANALDLSTVRELKQAVEATRDIPDTRIVVITGAGDKAFVAGADIHELGNLDVLRAEQFIRAVHDAFHAIRAHPAPVIAAINGYALGAGLELVMSCDVAIAAEHAQLGARHARGESGPTISDRMCPYATLDWSDAHERITAHR
jgi:enoyl-CoA hydratase